MTATTNARTASAAVEHRTVEHPTVERGTVEHRTVERGTGVRVAVEPGPSVGSGWRVRTAQAAVPAAAALVIVLPGLGARPMWTDEYATWHAATLSTGDLARLLDHIDAVLAPYYVFMHMWIAVFGDSPTSLRLPSALAVAAAAGLTSVLGGRLFHRWVGGAAGILFACLPMVSRYGQEARPYGLAVAAALISTWLLIRAFDDPCWSRWCWYAAALVGVGLTHIVALLILLPHAAAMWRPARRDLRVWRWTAAVAVTITVMLPLAAKGSQQSAAIAWIRLGAQELRQLPGRMFGTDAVAAVVIGFAMVGAVALWRRRRQAVLLLTMWAVGPVVFCYVTFPLLHLFLYRYLLFTVPAWCILAVAAASATPRLVGVLATATPRLVLRILVPRVLMVACLVVGTAVIGLPAQAAARRYPVGEPDFHGAAALVSSRMSAADGIAFGFANSDIRLAFSYELRGRRRRPRDVFLDVPAQKNGTFGALECAAATRCLADTTRIWLVGTETDLARQFTIMPRAIAQLLHDHFVVTETWTRSGVTTRLLTRTP